MISFGRLKQWLGRAMGVVYSLYVTSNTHFGHMQEPLTDTCPLFTPQGHAHATFHSSVMVMDP